MGLGPGAPRDHLSGGAERLISEGLPGGGAARMLAEAGFRYATARSDPRANAPPRRDRLRRLAAHRAPRAGQVNCHAAATTIPVTP